MPALNTDKFKKAKRRFSTTVGVGGFTAGSTTLPLVTASGLDTDTAITLVLGAGTASEEVITGVVSGNNVINCLRGQEGTSDVTHAAGTPVTMYFTETHWDDLINGILVSHNQDGTHKANTVTTDNIDDQLKQGWITLSNTPNTITYNGNRNYGLVFNSVDLSNTLSPGQKLKLTRTVAAPRQCTDLEAGSSQYYSKTSPAGMTFTDDFVVSAWVKLESYGDAVIASRYNGTSGWSLQLNSSGQVLLQGVNGGASNNSYSLTYASIPLNKWVHVTAQLDMSSFTATSTTSYTMIDGVNVPIQVVRGGTNPTALIQAGNLEIGGRNGGLFPFDGKIAQVAIFGAKVTQATMRTYMSQGLTGSETSLISAYSFNNSITDLNTTNANNLTAQGSAVATNADSPFANAVTAGLQEYAEINSVTFSTNTTVNVRVPETSMIPTSGGVSNVYYSTSDNPTGLPYFSNVIGEVQRNHNFTTQSTALTEVLGMTIPVVIPPNRKIRITFQSLNRANVTAGNSTFVYICEDSVSVNNVIGGTIAAEDSSGANQPAFATRTYNPTSGSKTYTMSFHGDGAGTNKVLSGTNTSPMQLIVELV